MSDHTPSPWLPRVLTHAERGDLLTAEEIGEYVRSGVLVSAEKSGSLEFVAVQAGDLHVCLVGNGPNRVANARLIAAAPALHVRVIAEAVLALVEPRKRKRA